MNLTPASSSDLPSEAILTRVSESGTRLMHTAIFIGNALSAVGYRLLEVHETWERVHKETCCDRV